MFRSKKDVDKHCQEVFRNIKNERERNLRCLSIAQQYYSVRDYESAKRYVSLYLSVKDDSSLGHKLLAQCHECFQEREKALNEYKYSLQLDPKQPELILRVCELLGESSIAVDKNQANYWKERGEVHFPYHPIIFKLKQKITALGDGNEETVESIILDEVKVRPNDPSVHNKLLTFLIENGRTSDAYTKAFMKINNFIPTLQWFQTAVQICKTYKAQFPNAVNEDFYTNYLFVLERALALSVQDVKIFRKSIPECITYLARFDETLSVAVSLHDKSVNFLLLINHMAGQLCYHTANILYRKVKWDENSVQDVSQLIAPLLLLSTSENFIVNNYKKQDTTVTRILDQCSKHNTYRIFQAGLVLLSRSKDAQQKFSLEIIFQFCRGNWKERILERVYSTSDFRSLCKSSFFVNYAPFSNLPIDLPRNLNENIKQYVSITEVTQPGSLHHLVWLGVQYLINSDKQSICDRVIPSKFCSNSFRSLQFSSSNTTSSYADTLSRIDVDAFLYACVYCAESAMYQKTDSNKSFNYQILPADVSKLLCSPEHELWWESAYQMATQTIPENNFSRVRSILQRGIEVIRLMENNNLPLPLLVLLARTFVNRAAVEPNADLAFALEERASLYWKAAIPFLKKIIRNEVHTYSVKSMFDYFGKVILKSDAVKLLNESKRFHEMQTLKGNNFVENYFSNETTVEFNTDVSSIQESPLGGLQSTSSVDEKILCTLMEQNMKIMDRLDTLFNKHELLSSNQLQLYEMVSVLAKKIDDFVIDSLTQAVQPLSPQNQTGGISQTNIAAFDSFKCINPIAIPSPLSTNYQYTYPTAGGIQTNFPMYQPIPSAYIPPVPPSTLPYVYGNVTQQSIPSQQTTLPVFDSFGTSTTMSRTPADIPNTIFSGFTPSMPISCTASPLASQLSTSYSTTPKKSSQFLSQESFSPTTSSNNSPSHSFQIKVPEVNLVTKPSVEIPEEYSDSDDDKQVVERDPLPDFKPIIPLPDEIVVKTGEEDEEILFESRAKLFRFVDKEWKERGVGMFKILKNKNGGRVRILMRREVVHKICANHFLSADMALTPMTKSDRAWIYCAPDFAEEKMVIEKLCVKFTTPEIANEFQKVFNQYKIANETDKSPKKSSSVTTSVQSPVVTVATTTAAPSKKVIVAPSLIKLSENNTLNLSTTTDSKPVFGGLSGNNAMNLSTTTDSKPVFGGFTFNSTPILTQPNKKVEEKPKVTPFSAFSGFTNSGSSKSSENNSLFGTTNVKPSEGTTKPEKDTASPFASVRETVDFSSLSKSSPGSNAFAKSENFKGFAGAGSLVFGNASSKKSSAVSAILKTNEASDTVSSTTGGAHTTPSHGTTDASNNDVEDEFVPTAEFTPVVSLPDIIEVKTGEEGLDVLFEDHCKLFRFSNNEWKERGIGKMKILRDPKDGSVRLLMRRDQVHKVCCNQRLSSNIELIPLKTNNKAWTWSNQDFSEGELVNELLCVRFKTIEQAEAFKVAFDETIQSILDNSLVNSFEIIETTKEEPKADLKKPLSELFKPKVGSWTCEVCYVNNTKDVDVCVACATPKEGASAPKSSTPSLFGSLTTASPSNTIDVNSKPNSEFKFMKPSTTSVSNVFSFGGSDIAKPVFSFGGTTNVAPPTNSPSFGFDTNKTTAKTNAGGPSEQPVFLFGKNSFDSSSPKLSSGGSLFGSSISTTENKSNDSSSPKLSSGGSLFGSLMSTTDNKSNETTSVVKTKEKVSIFSGTPIKSSETTSAFSSFSFKLDGNQASARKIDFASCNAAEENDSKSTSGRSSSGDDIEFVSETQASEEDKKLAESLKLPSNYYAYKYSDKTCPGCVGCEEEDLKNGIESKNLPSNKGEILSKNPLTSTNFQLNKTPPLIFGATVEANSNKGTFTFSSIFNKSLNTSTAEVSTGDKSSDEEEVVQNDHEPYFEPIVSLPDIVETKTGEEEEEILFRERSKLFLYNENTREWKERGVGELKILYHPVEKSYRLLLRREQVHKIVLNQRISSALKLQPLTSNNKSWCWFGMNLSEEKEQPELEKLAARFKTEEIKDKFEQVVFDCLSKLNDTQA